MKNVLILNDTRRNRAHVGCQEVMKNIEFLCNLNNIKIVATYENPDAYNDQSFSSNLKECEAIIINGEGTMHHDQLAAFQLLKSATIAKKQGLSIYLINSVWQDNEILNHNLDVFDKIFVRESLSEIQISRAGYAAKIVPDLSIFNTSPKEDAPNRKTERPTAFFDSVSWIKTKLLAKSARLHKAPFYTMNHQKILKRIKLISILAPACTTPKLGTERSIRSSEVIISGRFHALCLSIKNHVPCFCVASNTHKIEGTIKDIGLSSDRFIIADNQLLDLNNNRLAVSNDEIGLIKKYASQAQIKISEMFREISE